MRSKLAAPSITTAMPVQTAERLPAGLVDRSAKRSDRHDQPDAVEIDLLLEAGRIERPARRVDIGDEGLEPTFLDGESGADERQRGNNGKRSVGRRPPRRGEDRADERSGAGTRTHHRPRRLP